MAYKNPASKLERAVQAFLILQTKADAGETFISNDSRQRVIPNRTVIVTAFSPERPYRPEGTCYLQIQHHLPAAVQPNDGDVNIRRVEADEYLGATMDSMLNGDKQSLAAVADQITAAGRWLAQTDGTPEGDQVAADNADMVNFRCDWIKMATPFQTRGNNESGTNWVEILNFQAFVSDASN